MEDKPIVPPPVCASCGVPVLGKFCAACGEKMLIPDKDLSVWHFLTEAFENFTHLDSKLLRSLWMVLAKPGFLTAEFIAGRRVRYLKPIPLFAIAALVFYFFFSTTTAFFSSLSDMSDGYQNGNRLSNTFHVNTEAIFQEKVAATAIPPEQYWKEMAADAAQRSKAWMFLIVPVWGLLLWLFFQRRMPWLVPHLIFALHGLTYFILLDIILLTIFAVMLGYRQMGDWYTMTIAGIFSVYLALAVRRVYKLGKASAVLSGISAMVLFLLVLVIYRQSITIWTLMTH